MSLREDADYGGKSSKEGADLIISNAEEFIKKSDYYQPTTDDHQLLWTVDCRLTTF